MQSFITTLLTCSVTMSALALFYMAVTPFLAKRYSEKGRYYAWLIIVIGLIIPFRPQFNHAIVKLDMASEMAAPVIRIGNVTPVAIAASNAALPPALLSISWWDVATMVWLAGVTVFLAYHVIKHYCFIKMVKRWSENITDEQLFSLFQSLKAEMGISKEISLYQCSSIGSPMMIGFVTPRILLPKADLAHDELRFILTHELVHYKRKDLYYKCLVLIATAMHWFNPIVYLMAKEIDVGCELSCDAETMRGADEDTLRHYSETILGVAKYQSRLKTVLSTDFYGGNKGMKKRISSILDTKHKRVGMAILCGALIFTFGTAMVFSADTGAISTERDTGSYSAGDIVAVQIIADSVSDLNTYEFELHYDNSSAKPKSIHSAIDGVNTFGAPTDDGYLVVVAAKGESIDSINGENMPICEIIMEVMRDGPVEGLSFQRHYVSNSEPINSPTKSVEITSGWNVKIVPLSEEQRLIFEGQETNLMEPQDELPETVYLEEPISVELGHFDGDYSGQLRIGVEKQNVSPGESCRVDVSLSEPAELFLNEPTKTTASSAAKLTCWFDPDELIYQRFDGDGELHVLSETVDLDSGIVSITFVTPEDEHYLLDSFGSFHFIVPKNPQLSGRQSSLSIVVDYVIKDGDKRLLLSQSGEILLSIR